VPGEGADAKAVEQHEDRLALLGRFVVHFQAVDPDEATVRIGQRVGRDGIGPAAASAPKTGLSG